MYALLAKGGRPTLPVAEKGNSCCDLCEGVGLLPIQPKGLLKMLSVKRLLWVWIRTGDTWRQRTVYRLNLQSWKKEFLAPKSILVRKAATYPDHVVHGVDVTIPHVDSNSTKGKAIFLSSPMDYDWWFWVCDSRRKVSAWWGVPWRWVGGQRMRWHWTSQWGASVVIYSDDTKEYKLESLTFKGRYNSCENINRKWNVPHVFTKLVKVALKIPLLSNVLGFISRCLFN